jgi:hypothetical protein
VNYVLLHGQSKYTQKEFGNQRGRRFSGNGTGLHLAAIWAAIEIFVKAAMVALPQHLQKYSRFDSTQPDLG